MAVRKKPVPRGIRNNNPLNIKIGNTWLGEVVNPTEDKFEQFVTMAYGLRAAFCILRRYIRKYKRNTISDIIKTWAPDVENNTENYINVVCHLTGIDRDAEIEFSDRNTMVRLVGAMAFVECGEKIDTKSIELGYDMV